MKIHVFKRQLLLIQDYPTAISPSQSWLLFCCKCEATVFVPKAYNSFTLPHHKGSLEGLPRTKKTPEKQKQTMEKTSIYETVC